MKTNALSNLFQFWSRQNRDWKVTVTRSSMERFSYQMIFPYLSIYIIALGASKTQLGLVNSIGMIIAGLLGPLTGVLIDRNGPKKVYLFGIVLLITAYMTYALAPNWFVCIIAMGIYWIGNGSTGHSCATICGNCLHNKDSAKGMMLCETAAAGLLGIIAPMVAAFLLTYFGGVNVNGIRPLFYIAAMIAALAFLLVLTQLSRQEGTSKRIPANHLIKDGL